MPTVSRGIKIRLYESKPHATYIKINAPDGTHVDEVIETEYTPSEDKTCEDLMMIRAYRIKMLFESMGVNKNQLHPKAGKNLGDGESFLRRSFV